MQLRLIARHLRRLLIAQGRNPIEVTQVPDEHIVLAQVQCKGCGRQIIGEDDYFSLIRRCKSIPEFERLLDAIWSTHAAGKPPGDLGDFQISVQYDASGVPLSVQSDHDHSLN
jgi:hypothetical protein